MVHKGADPQPYTTDNNPWFGNLFYLSMFSICSWMTLPWALLFGFFGSPDMFNQIMFLPNFLPEDTRAWQASISLHLDTDNYHVIHDEYSEWIVLQPIEGHENTLIWLHENNGRADSYFHEWANQNIISKTTRILLPQAPYRKMTTFPHFWQFQWFNKIGVIGPNYFGPSLTVADKDKLYDQPELSLRADLLNGLIEMERRFLPDGKRTTKRIYIGGQAEGGMMALAAFLRYNQTEPLGGIFAIGALQALEESNMDTSKNAQLVQSLTPMLMINGDQDQNVELIEAKYTFFYFEQETYKNTKNYKFIRAYYTAAGLQNPADWANVSNWLDRLTAISSTAGQTIPNPKTEPKIESGGQESFQPRPKRGRADLFESGGNAKQPIQSTNKD